MTRWNILLDLGSKKGRTLPLQIVDAFTDRIRSSQLQPGERLPGTRSLATALGVSRNTVEAAYCSLRLEGWIVSEGRRGTFVNRELPVHDLPAAMQLSPTPLGFDLGPARATRIPSADPLPTSKDTLRWDFGVPDVRLAPALEFSRAIRRALQNPERSLNYRRYRRPDQDPLAKQLLSMLAATRGLYAKPENLLVTRGSQMALYLLAQALIRPGDRVAVEDPGYPGAWDAFVAAGAELVSLPVDEEGVSTQTLSALLSEGPIRAVFVTPHHQFPTTVAMSAPRRLELLRLARTHRLVIVEDDYDHEFHYEGRPILPLASRDEGNNVVYVGSVSKVFAPGLRLGYMVGHEELVARCLSGRAVVDLEGDPWAEEAVAEMLEDGELARHLRRARRTYQQRRDSLVSLLSTHLGDELEFSVPHGGMAIWARVAPHLNVDEWAANARRLGLLFRTGAPFYRTEKTEPFVRLGFAKLSVGELEKAVFQMKSAILQC